MHSPALAIAWEFRQRHRWGLIALVGYLLLMVTTRLLIFEPGRAISLADSQSLPEVAPRFAATVITPLSIFSYYFLAVFSFGLTGDLTARQSLYPARMFALPVSTAALAGWPMLYGSAVIAGLWVIATRFAVWPSGVDVSLIWPALRVVAAVMWLAAMDAAAFTAIDRKVAESVMIAVLAPQIPLAYLCACLAVAKARRGEMPDWRPRFARLGAMIAAVLPRRREHFPSAARAQGWFEWRLHGRTLPVWVSILLPFELAFLFVAGTETPSLVVYTLFGTLLTPPLMAAFVARGVRRSNPQVSDAVGMPPFTATRPVTSAALIAAKLRMTMWSTLTPWLVVVIAIPVALSLSGTWPVVIARARDVSDFAGPPRAAVLALLGLLGLLASTWKQLVQGLYVGVSGREWLIRASNAVALTLLIFVEPIAQWIRDNGEVRVALWNALPWIFGVLVCVKLAAAVWIAPRLQASRLFSDRALVTGAAGWLAAVLALYGVLVWLVLSPHVPRYFLLLLAILAVPLARLSAAPLALAGK